MFIFSKNLCDIYLVYKEVVVDSLFNGLLVWFVGWGDFYKVIYGIKFSVVLMLEFIVLMFIEECGGDEEVDLICISVYGMDF